MAYYKQKPVTLTFCVWAHQTTRVAQRNHRRKPRNRKTKRERTENEKLNLLIPAQAAFESYLNLRYSPETTEVDLGWHHNSRQFWMVPDQERMLRLWRILIPLDFQYVLKGTFVLWLLKKICVIFKKFYFLSYTGLLDFGVLVGKVVHVHVCTRASHDTVIYLFALSLSSPVAPPSECLERAHWLVGSEAKINRSNTQQQEVASENNSWFCFLEISRFSVLILLKCSDVNVGYYL